MSCSYLFYVLVWNRAGPTQGDGRHCAGRPCLCAHLLHRARLRILVEILPALFSLLVEISHNMIVVK